ncbi:hypothetical protein AV530_005528 [Patagioenas fasciata monilis]|uniref:Uncharacterized protein n=1 Tax=Patagioenas fasciata monilis TaxID=372326 RepID=A0A1V4JLT2_PATFA|nr:hypothetical protein AV530_005528 [Patagioenas fasciata monilis]
MNKLVPACEQKVTRILQKPIRAQKSWQALSCIEDEIMTPLTLMGVMPLAERYQLHIKETRTNVDGSVMCNICCYSFPWLTMT